MFKIISGNRSTLYLSKSLNNIVEKYSVTSKSPAFKSYLRVQKYQNQNVLKVPKVKVLIIQNGSFLNHFNPQIIIIDAFMCTAHHLNGS